MSSARYIETDPAWVVEFLIVLITLTGGDDAPWWLDRVRQAHPDADGELVALIEGAWNEHHQHLGQPLEAIRRLRAGLDAVGGTPPSHGLLPLVHASTARAYIQAGEPDQAGAVLERAFGEPVGSPVADDVRHPGIAAFVAALAGDLCRADELAASSVTAADQLGLCDHELGRIFAGLARVELHVERDEHEPALQVLDEVKRAAEESHRLTVQSLVTLQRAKVARVFGDEVGAGTLLAQTRLSYAAPDAAVRQVLGEEAVSQALQFDPSRAAGLIAELDPDRVGTQVLRARLARLGA